MRLLGGDTKMNKAQEVVHPIARSEICWALTNVYGFLYMSSTQLMNWISTIMLIYMFLETWWLMNPLPLFQVPFVSTLRPAWPATRLCLAEKPLLRPSYSRGMKHDFRKQLTGYADGAWSRLGGGKWWSNDKNQWQMTERERGGLGGQWGEWQERGSKCIDF